MANFSELELIFSDNTISHGFKLIILLDLNFISLEYLDYTKHYSEIRPVQSHARLCEAVGTAML